MNNLNSDYDIFDKEDYKPTAHKTESEIKPYPEDELEELASLESLSSLIFEADNDEESKGQCLTCGGTGRAFGSPFSCPKCGEKFKGEATKPEILNDSDTGLKVPRKYLEKGKWELAKTPGSTDGFYGDLDAILKNYDFRTGGIDTMFIIAPPGTGCRTWAYTLLKENEKNGALIGRIMSTVDAMTERGIKELDILVLTLPRYKLTESLEFLESIIYDRETNGKATFILTNIPKAHILTGGFSTLNNTAFLIKTRE